MAAEDAAGWAGEQLRSAFAISAGHVLTAWHCVRDLLDGGEPLWFRLRATGTGQAYDYLPVVLADHDTAWDVAVLTVDDDRLRQIGLDVARATEVLAAAVIPLGMEVKPGDPVRVLGFPSNAPTSADHDTELADVALPLGSVHALKLTGPAFAACDPVHPAGLSGGPVVRRCRVAGMDRDVAVALVRALPRGQEPGVALGGSLVATRIEDVAGVPAIAAALLPEARPDTYRVGVDRQVETSLVTMLRADAAMVDFFGRKAEVELLTNWCHDGTDRSAVLLSGPAGQGKTRLARRLLEVVLGGGGWAGILVRGAGDVGAVRDLLRRARASDHAVLVVVDYAAEFGAVVLNELVETMTGEDVAGARWRILLVARHGGDWWQPEGARANTGVQAQLTRRGAAVGEPVELSALASTNTGDRRAAFARIRAGLRPAVAAFAAVHAMPLADPATEPDLADADLGSALMLHLAAVVSLLPAAGPEREPNRGASAGNLVNRVLDLEAERHWLYADPSRLELYPPTRAAFGDLGDGPGGAAVVETAVAAATLVGAASRSEATAVIRVALGVDAHRAAAIADWLHDLYPTPEAGAGWLPPLQPDRLGEELITRVMRRQRDDGIVDDDLLPHTLLRAVHGGSITARHGLGPAQIHRLLTVLLRAATRARDVADLLAAPDGTGGLVAAVPGQVDMSVVVAALPRSSRYLQPAAVALTRHALSHHDQAHQGWRESPSDEHGFPATAQGARLLNNLGIRLSDLGRREEALAVTEQAIEIYRRLAAARPDAFDPDLAMALNSLGIRLSDLGRREEALAATEQAIEIRWRLAAARPDAFEPDLASALTSLGIHLSDLGRREEALAATEQAIEIYRRLAVARPDAFEPDLAMALNNLGMMLSNLGRREEALAATGEAVEIYRRLAVARPDAFEPNLASALNNLGVRLSNLGRREEALAATEQAIEIYRRLAAARPDAFEPDLARALNNLGIWLSNLGRREEALAATEQAIEIRWRLAAARPDAFEPDLARALNNLGVRLSNLGRREEALAATEQAIEIHRRLAAARPDAFEPDLARSLWAAGWVVANAPQGHDRDSVDRALTLAQEAVTRYESLASRRPAVFAGDLEAARGTRDQLQDALDSE
ncbi:MAG: tetratricopeptide repeat protein [Kineosporiaceae bacterium]|nr:tetratricopeptide repeat protein [Kineosporiaceae bacterium]